MRLARRAKKETANQSPNRIDGSSAFTDQIDPVGVIGALRKQRVTSLSVEMMDVDDGGEVIEKDGQHVTGFHCMQTLPRHRNRQGAQ